MHFPVERSFESRSAANSAERHLDLLPHVLKSETRILPNPTSFDSLSEEEFIAAQSCFLDRKLRDDQAGEGILTNPERLFGYLNEQFMDSPQWAEYVIVMTGFIQDRFSPSPEVLEELRNQMVYLFFESLAKKVPTLTDLVKQFEDTVLKQSDPAMSVINQVRIALRKHPKRQLLIDDTYGGDESRYVDELTKRWKLACKKTDGKISVDTFLRVCEKELDEASLTKEVFVNDAKRFD
jgi:hypothetical protein